MDRIKRETLRTVDENNHSRFPSPTWRWMNDNCLVVDSGSRPVVLTASNEKGKRFPRMMTCDEFGILEPLDTNSYAAKVIAAAPDMADALKLVKEEMIAACGEESLQNDIAFLKVKSVLNMIGEL